MMCYYLAIEYESITLMIWLDHHYIKGPGIFHKCVWLYIASVYVCSVEINFASVFHPIGFEIKPSYEVEAHF